MSRSRAKVALENGLASIVKETNAAGTVRLTARKSSGRI
jgi:hypothetical protein